MLRSALDHLGRLYEEVSAAGAHVSADGTLSSDGEAQAVAKVESQRLVDG